MIQCYCVSHTAALRRCVQNAVISVRLCEGESDHIIHSDIERTAIYQEVGVGLCLNSEFSAYFL